ncbi:MAG: hypothetical protein ABSG73_04055 [Candidatus Aminicenantales bacterium]|jgi:hypothetical protein
MSKKDIESALARGVEILNEFLPVKTYLFFPILYSACVWAVRRVFDYRERIFSWQVWLDPEEVRTKPDEFILHFFRSHEALGRAYADEVSARDMKALRAAFPALYPVCGLEDAFLKALFKKELAASDYRKIAAEFESRATKAREDIRSAEESTHFWAALENLGAELAALGIHLLKDEEVQNAVIRAVKKKAAKSAKSR